MSITKLFGKVVTPSAIVLVLEKGGAMETVQVPSTDARFEPVTDWLKHDLQDLRKLAELLIPPVIPDIKEIAAPLQNKFAEAHFAKADTKALKRFNERLATNPTRSAQQSLFGYIEKHGVTVDADGCMVFYKRVNRDMGSFHDPSFKYKVGEWSEVPRNRCVDQPTESCGFGLHVCPWKFLDNWFSGGVILEIVVPPENFTSVPPSSGKLLAYKVFTRRIVPAGQIPTNPIVETEASRAVSDPKLRREMRKEEEKESEVNLGTGTATDPAPAPKKKVAVEAGATAELKHRKVPAELIQAADMQAGTESTLRIIATDPRSRFLLLTTLDDEQLQGKAGNKILKRPIPFHETTGNVSLDDYSVAIPLAMFTAAQINGRSPYTARVLGRGLIEIRPA
jgi:hypothetical protein